LTVPAKPTPLRPPLQSTWPTNYSSDHNNYSSLGSSRADSCNIARSGAVQQLDKQLPLLERDRQIALVEGELELTRRLIEVKRREQEMAIQLEVQRGLGENLELNIPRLIENGVEVENNQVKLDDQVDIREELLKQVEKARKEELERQSKVKLNEAFLTKKDLSSTETSRMKFWEWLERKRREINPKNGTDIYLGSSVNYDDAPCEVFNSDEEGESLAQNSAHNMGFVYQSAEDFASALGEDITEQQELWDRIKREEEESVKRLEQSGVVKEQREILNKIQEENERRKKEEELTMKLIAELSLNDQRKQQKVIGDVLARGAAASAQSIVAAPQNREMEERIVDRQDLDRRHRQRKWDVNSNQQVGSSNKKIEQFVAEGATFKDILVNGKSRGLNMDMAEYEGGSRAFLELKLRIAEQERNTRARIEKESLERKWEMANSRKENGFRQQRTGKTEKTKKQR